MRHVNAQLMRRISHLDDLKVVMSVLREVTNGSQLVCWNARLQGNPNKAMLMHPCRYSRKISKWKRSWSPSKAYIHCCDFTMFRWDARLWNTPEKNCHYRILIDAPRATCSIPPKRMTWFLTSEVIGTRHVIYHHLLICQSNDMSKAMQTQKACCESVRDLLSDVVLDMRARRWSDGSACRHATPILPRACS